MGQGASGYLKLGRSLEEFDLVYAYPWGGEEAMMQDLMRTHGAPGAGLLLHRVSGEVQLMRRQKIERTWSRPSPDVPAP